MVYRYYEADHRGVQSASLDGRKYNIAVSQIDIGTFLPDYGLGVCGPLLIRLLVIGNAATSMGSKMGNGVPQADGSMKNEATFEVEHVASSIVYMASLPLGVNVLTHTM